MSEARGWDWSRVIEFLIRKYHNTLERPLRPFERRRSK